MARFSYKDADKYGGQGGAGYFSLRDDGDIARVRFLYETPEDVQGDTVHEVEVDGKKRYVNCLRAYNQPVDDCPFCKDGRYAMAKLFIPLYNEDEKKVQVWERGKKFFSKLSSVLSRCDADPIVSQVFDIERRGKKGDTQTEYDIYEPKKIGPDDAVLDDYDLPEIIGGVVLDKSADDMEFYLDNGYFPPDEDEMPKRSSRRRDEEDEAPRRRESASRRSSRRTPANEDVY